MAEINSGGAAPPRVILTRELAAVLRCPPKAIKTYVESSLGFPKPLKLSPSRMVFLHTEVEEFLRSAR